MRLAILAPDLARGVRAAIATVVPFYLALAYAEPALAWVAIGGWLGSLADPGGTRRTRALGMAWFVPLGGFAVAIGGAAAAATWLAAASVAAIAFLAALARALGGNAGAIANTIAIAAAIAASARTDQPALAGAMFALGALWAVALSSIAWPVGPHLPVRRALARAYRELAAYARAAAALAGDPRAAEAAWSTLARTQQRAVRAAIEEARSTMVASRARRTGESPVGANLRQLLGDADAQLFMLVALAEQVEAGNAPAPLAELAAIYAATDGCLLTRRPGPDLAAGSRSRLVDAARAAHALARDLDATPATVETTVAHPHPRSTALRDSLTPRSPVFRHGIRVAATVAIAISIAGAISPAHASWIVVTALAVLQPYLGPTLVRVVERVVGTVVGGALAVGLMAAFHAPLALALVMVPLSIAAVVTRPRSYRLFVVFLTPVFLLVADRWHPDSGLALVRIADVAIGGALAIVAAFVIPSVEHGRLPDALAAVLDALAAYVEHVAVGRRGELASARRAVGVALENAEASLERMLAEPAALQRGAEPAMFLVTYGRRLSAALTSVTELGELAQLPADVHAYVLDALAAARQVILGGRPPPPREPPEAPPALARLVHFAELIRGVT